MLKVIKTQTDIHEGTHSSTHTYTVQKQSSTVQENSYWHLEHRLHPDITLKKQKRSEKLSSGKQ